ncbi:MAG: hypothetical protein A2204_04355 [Elusimicrobia bacterium RIFOXYA1_FULL_47_7]|nr:MAG: hypothetical protein A2278_06470 [Elusimicrobia bacterium RIFOXYA12_FULL_49_49]OGS06679.1 MAG: hypothetical protein A2204_04355 [Elusimicrobia bacterium RIFOXYA1_FULL_47_7]OGS09595.1 MAG: hypothetical protein A2386_07545 [Elusimicrobia bacterium RIFOXYB1_FULL_48_9]OGS16469.1 MAG: hypothetical protein A2251_06555 [Elusimicrobia bacterium RIFOXYA2_FULL_47_53]OGS26026.1 MAG: hypothetical protein A2339_01330 [Elusimicrobia bacterium RIFOXYB12_FULL_50_12]OGS29643.1 MAG: hypothetical protein
MKQSYVKLVPDSRASHRVKLSLPVRYKIRYNNKDIDATKLEDLGGDGMQLEVARELKKGAKVKVSFAAGKGDKPFSSESRVMWCKKVAAKKPVYHVGIKMPDASRKQKEQYALSLYQLMQKYLPLMSVKSISADSKGIKISYKK